tara:strand:- start:9045 stop:9746 length:702 start_codon:yes stop_codon:yes gene_type:complete
MIAGIDRLPSGRGLLGKIEDMRLLLNTIANISGDGESIGVDHTATGITIRFLGDASGGPASEAEVSRFKLTSIEDNYVVGKEVDQNDALVGDVETSIAKHEYLRGSAAPVVYAVDDIIIATKVKNGTSIFETGNMPPRVNWVGLVLIRKSDSTATVGGSSETVAAASDTWDRAAQSSNRGVADTRLVRMGYDDTAGTPALRGYYRTYTYDSDGNLVTISAESDVTIFTPVVCS